jgi:hypothetical protein
MGSGTKPNDAGLPFEQRCVVELIHKREASSISINTLYIAFIMAAGLAARYAA